MATTESIKLATSCWNAVADDLEQPVRFEDATDDELEERFREPNVSSSIEIPGLEWHPFAIPVRKAAPKGVTLTCEATASICDLLVDVLNRIVEGAQEAALGRLHGTTPNVLPEYLRRQVDLDDNFISDTQDIVDICFLTSRDIQRAILTALPGMLGKYAVCDGVKNVFRIARSFPIIGEKLEQHESQSSWNISPECVWVWLETAVHRFRTDIKSAYYLSGVLDYILTEVMDVSIIFSGKHSPEMPLYSSDIITAKHVARAIQDDEELSALFAHCALLHGSGQELLSLQHEKHAAPTQPLAKVYVDQPAKVLTVLGFRLDGSIANNISKPTKRLPASSECLDPTSMCGKLSILRFAARAGVKYIDPSLIHSPGLLEMIEKMIDRLAIRFTGQCEILCRAYRLSDGDGFSDLKKRAAVEAQRSVAACTAIRETYGITVCGTGGGLHETRRKGCWWATLPKLFHPKSRWLRQLKVSPNRLSGKAPSREESKSVNLEQAAILELALQSTTRGLFHHLYPAAYSLATTTGPDILPLTQLYQPPRPPLGMEEDEDWKEKTSATSAAVMRDDDDEYRTDAQYLDRPYLLASMLLLRGGLVLKLGHIPDEILPIDSNVGSEIIPLQANGFWMCDDPQVVVWNETVFRGSLFEAAKGFSHLLRLSLSSHPESDTMRLVQLGATASFAPAVQHALMMAATVADRVLVDKTKPAQIRSQEQTIVYEEVAQLREACVLLCQREKDVSRRIEMIDLICNNFIEAEKNQAGSISRCFNKHHDPVWEPKLFYKMMESKLQSHITDLYLDKHAACTLQAAVERVVIQAFQIAKDEISTQTVKELVRLGVTPSTDDNAIAPLTEAMVIATLKRISADRST